MQGVQLPRCPSVDLQSRRAWKEAGTQGHDGTRRANTGCPVLLEALYSVTTTCVVDTIQLRTLHTERLKDLPKVTDEAGVTQVPRT